MVLCPGVIDDFFVELFFVILKLVLMLAFVFQLELAISFVDKFGHLFKVI